eukprot:1407119-Amphidinium_carterae.1
MQQECGIVSGTSSRGRSTVKKILAGRTALVSRPIFGKNSSIDGIRIVYISCSMKGSIKVKGSRRAFNPRQS